MLSICIPAYNYGHYLPETINSALAQDLDFELVVLDNASTDDTPALRERYLRDPRVRWVRNDMTLPVQKNWNRAVELTTREWVKVLQADDRLVAGALPRLDEILRSEPQAWFHGHMARVIGPEGEFLRDLAPYTLSRVPLRLQAGEGLPLKLRQISRLREPTSNLFRKQAWQQIGGYRSDLRFTFDMAFNVQMLARYPGVLWSEALAEVRRHAQSDGARLPADLALGDLKQVVQSIEQAMGPKFSIADHRAAQGWLQYRAVELVAQRRHGAWLPLAGFLARQSPLLADVRAWPVAAGIAWRRWRTGDVQRQVAL